MENRLDLVMYPMIQGSTGSQTLWEKGIFASQLIYLVKNVMEMHVIDINDENDRPNLDQYTPEEIFIFKVKFLIRYHSTFWDYLGQKKPNNPNVWLGSKADITENFIGKLLRGDSTIAMKRANDIAIGLKIPLWQLCKPDYDFLDIVDNEK
jgi:hypothetical protein